MIKFADLLSEKFELPPDLEKQLENTGYSVLGHILTPHFEKLKKKFLQNKDLNQKSYQSIKNVISYIKQLSQSGGNTKLTLSDVYVPDYYSTTESKDTMKKVSVTIEKSGNDIYVESDEKKNKLFPDLVISKDYAGWDFGRLTEFWNRMDDSYKDFEKEFDERLVSIDSVLKKTNSWKSLDKPRKPKFKEPNLMFVFEKTISETGQPYEHYFRVFNSKKDDASQYTDYFSPSTPPKIIQTIYLDQFNLLKYNFEFNHIVSSFINTSRHEGRHLLQHVGNINKKLRGDFYGGPKKSLKHQYNPDVRGSDFSGMVGPTTKFKDPNDPYGKVFHPFRDVEFKTNLYNYKEDLEQFLNTNVSKNKWKDGFNDAIRYAAGVIDYNSFRKKYPYSSTFSYTILVNHFKELYKHDKPKFNQFVKELYKLIFNK